MNYTELVSTIKGYAENDFPETVGDFTSDEQIATFVQQAEQRVYNFVQLPSLRRNVTGNLTSGNKYLSCPLDFLSVYSLAVIDGNGDYQYLLNKDVNFIRQAYPSPTDEGLPAYYAIFGPNSVDVDELSIIVGPMPDDDYEVELHYFYYPESIVTAQTSWLGDNFDSVLLYGALLEAAAFMKSDADVIANYKARYDEAMTLLRNLGDGKLRSDAYRSGQSRSKAY